MLMDSFDTMPGESAQLRSPVITNSDGCLELTFYYYLYGTSTTMKISVHTITGSRWCACVKIGSKVTFQCFNILFFSPDVNPGPALFEVTGNQGQGWKLATVQYKGTSAPRVCTWRPQWPLCWMTVNKMKLNMSRNTNSLKKNCFSLFCFISEIWIKICNFKLVFRSRYAI